MLYETLYTLLKTEEYPLQVAKAIAKPIALEKLSGAIETCDRCIRCKKNGLPYIWGNPNATTLVILTWPDYLGAEQMFLDQAFEKFNINKDALAFCYAINGSIWNSDQKQPPCQEEISGCAKFVTQAIEIIEPLTILCLSTLATSLFNKHSLDYNMAHTTFINSTKIYTTFPPGYLLKLKEKKSELYSQKEHLFYELLAKCFAETEVLYSNPVWRHYGKSKIYCD